jgi:hypothetical protein
MLTLNITFKDVESIFNMLFFLNVGMVLILVIAAINFKKGV